MTLGKLLSTAKQAVTAIHSSCHISQTFKGKNTHAIISMKNPISFSDFKEFSDQFVNIITKNGKASLGSAYNTGDEDYLDFIVWGKAVPAKVCYKTQSIGIDGPSDATAIILLELSVSGETQHFIHSSKHV